MKNVPKITPTNDLLFRKLMTSQDSGHILKAFVRDILGKEFKTLKPRETYHIDSYKKSLKKTKLLRTEVDVLAVAEDGTQVTIEMLVHPHYFFEERAVFYLSKVYASPYGDKKAKTYIKKNNYSALCPVYGINILGFDLFEVDDDAIQTFSLRNDKTYKPFLNKRKQRILTLCFFSLTNVNIEQSSAAYHWQRFFNTGEVSVEAPDYLKDAQRITDYHSMERDEQAMTMRVDKAQAIKDAEIAYAWEDGLEEGADRKTVEIALNMLEKGLPLDVITDVTGLTVDQVSELKKV
ncbi:Rpn family recombination-promoting nuclease/putative transposase [Enterococcus sp. 669A]|uniref:Rpn family recombination-promoting nuclease/putative transposase n=1 Tax=Candidatus Enterococcus moelleringii TaxID=2815325 RepID=A0ABS3L710_9ENTE|nr:Rpn family recombination-promoting nuclease/putative transposase [Enterococcus sp. 669A]MBO1305410.1 Rpn family recombination-promoting nuclease/putative transposase [Enterococcus sp. 669A]